MKKDYNHIQVPWNTAGIESKYLHFKWRPPSQRKQVHQYLSNL